MSTVLLPSCYFPPISYFVKLNEYGGGVIDMYENFKKQTYRNRCEIMGANGKLNLIVPTLHDGKRQMNEIEIANNEDWQKQHLKSIKSAYQSSPYYEYYEDQIKPIFERDFSLLVDLNQAILGLCFELMKWEVPIEKSTKYEEDFKGYDARDLFDPKQPTEEKFTSYHQVFEDRLPFEPNLSIFDLICNLGPESAAYIKKNTTS